MHPPTFLFALLFSITVSVTAAHHAKQGKLITHSEAGTGSKPFLVTTEEDVRSPILEWDELSADGATVQTCTLKEIRFGGTLDMEDFQVTTVLTFDKDDYFSLGCKLPSTRTWLMEKDQIVFREITWVRHLKDGSIIVGTQFADGASVIPDVFVTIGERAVDAVRISESEDNGNNASRINSSSIALNKEEFTLPISDNIEAAIEASGRIGFRKIAFSRRDRTFSSELNFEVDVKAKIQAEGVTEFDGATTPLGPFPIAGLSLKVPGLGALTVGFVWQLTAVASVTFTAAFDAGFDWKSATGVRIDLNTSDGPSVTALGESDKGSTADISFDPESVGVGAMASGFIGVRPEILATIDAPIFDDISVTAGLSGGVLIEATSQVPLSPPIRDPGLNFGPCGEPHFLEGSLFTQGRDLSVDVSVPFFDDVTFDLAPEFLSFEVGTVCAVTPALFESIGALPSATETPAPSLPSWIGATIEPDPSPALLELDGDKLVPSGEGPEPSGGVPEPSSEGPEFGYGGLVLSTAEPGSSSEEPELSSGELEQTSVEPELTVVGPVPCEH